jgi:catechol 2,3-dioxygenase-like lactoylglutathione lyase family enzyme
MHVALVACVISIFISIFELPQIASAQGQRVEGQQQSPREAAAVPVLTHGLALTAVSHSVNNLEKTAAFYRSLFGLVPFGSFEPMPLVNSSMAKLTNTGNAKYRQATLRLPNTGVVLRLMEFAGVERAPLKPGLTDPGQVVLRLMLNDMPLTLANLQKVNAEFVLGAPSPGTSSSFAVVRDPDGYLLTLEPGQGPQGSSVDQTAVNEVHVVVITADTDKSLTFYKNVLGVDFAPGVWGKLPVGNGEIRRSVAHEFGGPQRIVELCEYRNVGAGTPVKARLQDPPASLVSFIVRDMSDTLKAVNEAKSPIVTAGGAPVTIASLPRIVVRDPDGAFVELVQE